jgi:hypothetical protein
MTEFILARECAKTHDELREHLERIEHKLDPLHNFYLKLTGAAVLGGGLVGGIGFLAGLFIQFLKH